MAGAAPRLFDIRMADGSRHFADLPERYDPITPQWEQLREHLPLLPGVTLTGYVTDQVTEAWLDLHYRGHEFSLNNQQGSWWLFVKDPGCPEEILQDVYRHCQALLDPAS